ncbi:MAG: HPr family phosphocarrier protein [Lachnospiraceae bacterium]|nr:HPr family phosphocarrier protein [Lachnospiraceae bacterium]
MKFFQKLGKSLMLPVSALPICGLLMGLGYLLCPSAMQGGSMEGVADHIGYFLIMAGGALINNMALLFAIGVGVGMSEKNDGTGAVASLVAWLTITTLLSADNVTALIPSIAEDAGKVLAFSKTANPFIGILSGIIGSSCYNRFKGTKLPSWLAFFSGKRSVAIVAGLVSILASFVLLFIWPIIFTGLTSLGEGIASMGSVGAGIYAFLNRLLIPTGLHHALNNVFWFDTTGLGDLTHFWAGETSADVSWSLGMYMSGFFPCMMFGVPGAALAIIRCSEPKKRKAMLGIMLSGAICSFVCGVTEPFEFAFMFISPMLYVVYSLMYGLITFLAVITGFRAGFCFSGGALDLMFSSSLPAAERTWLILPLGALAFVLFFCVFKILIDKWKLVIPIGEETDILKQSGINSKGEATTSPYYMKARTILLGLGGRTNVISIDNCITRLRLDVKDSYAIDEKMILSSGAKGVIKVGEKAVQIVIGADVQFVADEMNRLYESDENLQEISSTQAASKGRGTDDAIESGSGMNYVNNESSKKHRTITHNDTIFEDDDINFEGNSFEYVLKDPSGIHARPAGMIASIVKKYCAEITVKAGEKSVSASSMTDLMSLGSSGGTKITISADGEDADKVLSELYQYMRDNL